MNVGYYDHTWATDVALDGYNGYMRYDMHATSQNVTGLIPLEVIGFFNRPNPSSHTMMSTQPLTEISTRNLPER
jgi:hypothetical protein